MTDWEERAERAVNLIEQMALALDIATECAERMKWDDVAGKVAETAEVFRRHLSQGGKDGTPS